MFVKVTNKPIITDDQIPAPFTWASLIPQTTPNRIPDSTNIRAQVKSFLKNFIQKGIYTFPQTISSGSGALEQIISDS